MAGWSMLSNGSGLDCAETKLQNQVCIEIDNSVKPIVQYTDDSKHLLYQNPSVFMKEIADRNSDKPIPPLLGDGRSVDLFKLFWAVREKGGFKSISKKGLWAFVAEEMDLKGDICSCVKLIYIKYLAELDHLFDKELRSVSFTNPQSEHVPDSGYSFKELENESPRGLLSFNKIVDGFQFDSEKSVNDDDENTYINHEHVKNGIVLSELSVVDKKGTGFRKRKHESLSEMLSWLTAVAKHPNDQAIGSIPDGFLAEALRAREVLLLPKISDSIPHQCHLQKKPKMHPCMYEDPSASLHQYEKRLRFSERQPSLPKSHACPPCPATKIKIASIPEEETVAKAEILDIKPTGDSIEADPLERSPLVGPTHQAVVPVWTGATVDSDPKWLGTRIWPLQNRKGDAHTELVPIGKGRGNSCNCQFPGSVVCTRLHISEKRMTLKLELGSAFYHWKFDSTGEEVSIRWNLIEEKRFKEMVRRNPPSLNKCFWDKAFKYFPRKKREKLVNYYFNVFVLRRRSYQNRVTPKNVDSDDDESGFGSFSERYGHEAVEVSGSKLLVCTLNNQQTELE